MSKWWWSSNNGSNSDAQPQTSTPSQTTPETTSQSTPTSTLSSPPATPNRNDQAFEDLRSMFSAVNPTATQKASQAAREHVENLAKKSSESDEDAYSLYPSTMSCTQCFDLAYHCNSPGGQLMNVYRYGGLRECGELWAQWRFCMRTKTMGDEEARRRIRDWNRDKAARKKLMRNSEEVWKLREAPGEGI